MAAETLWEGHNMKPTFLNHDKPLLTAMLQSADPEIIIERIRKSLELGAEAFGLQVESLAPEYQNQACISQLIAEMQGKPCYVTNYRKVKGRTDEQLAEGLIEMVGYGATLFDVMGDLFCKHADELTDNPEAIEKQMKLIDKLHSMGAEVIMSSHMRRFVPTEEVLEMALEQQRRGADIVKIVTFAENMEQQLENLRTTHLLKEKLDVPYLFLSTGECSIHRRLGGIMGCCMYLCVCEYNITSPRTQPLIKNIKPIRDNFITTDA
jgi:3-dehydroquinate dehydratase type I